MLTTAQLAKRLTLSPSWIYEHANKEEDPLPGRKPGGVWLFDPAEVMTYLDKFSNQKRTPPPARPQNKKRILRHLKLEEPSAHQKGRESRPSPPEEAGQ